MQLERLIAALAPTDVVGDSALEIRELAYDAREVQRGSLFFCVPGAKADGHDFAVEALEQGAVALVVERRLEVDAAQLVVPSMRAAMPRAAVEFFDDPTALLPVAAVTGTNGKTTTAYLLWAILAAAGQQPGLLTNVERRVGTDVREVGLNTPESIDLQRLFHEMLEQGNRSCVLEATSMASAKGRLQGTRFALLVCPNLTQDQLGGTGGGARARSRRPPDLRLRGRRRSRPGKATLDGTGCHGARRHLARDVGQSAQRGSGRNRRRGRRRAPPRGGARPAPRDRAGPRVRPAGRRRGDRGQGS